MAVSHKQCNFFTFAYILMLGGSLAVCIYNSLKGMNGLGTNKTIADAFATSTTVIHAILIVVMGIELVMRSSMSAFLVYPCDFQKRSFCCFDYSMPTIWLAALILSVLALVASAVITVVLIILQGVANINIVRVIPVIGISALQLIFSAISLKMSRGCLLKEKAEEEGDMFEAEEEVPLEPAAYIDEMSPSIPKSPMVRSPMLGESPIPRSPMPVGSPAHNVAMAHLANGMSPRWATSMGRSPANAVYSLRGSANVGRYSPTVKQAH